MADSAATRADLEQTESRILLAFATEIAKLATKDELRTETAKLATKDEFRTEIAKLATKEELQTAIGKLAAHVGRQHTKLANAVHDNGCMIEALTSDIRALSEGQENLAKHLVAKLDDMDERISGRFEVLEATVKEHSKALGERSK